MYTCKPLFIVPGLHLNGRDLVISEMSKLGEFDSTLKDAFLTCFPSQTLVSLVTQP